MNDMTHRDSEGNLQMVDVGDKKVTRRVATAIGRVFLKSAYDAVKSDRLKKGSALECARIAGIMAAKKTAELIPLCHSLLLHKVDISFEFDETSLIIRSQVETDAKTGVEMEALTAVSVASLTVYDMAKSIEKGIEINGVHLDTKSGGKSGEWKY